MHRIMIISGDPSSDVYGADLLKKCPNNWQITGIGGPLMRHIRPTLLDQSPLATFGLTAALKNIVETVKLYRKIKKLAQGPKQTILLIDAPGFNLRLLPMLKKNGHHVIYWIPPQVWAWHESRIKLLRRYVDELWVLYQFECDYFQHRGCQVKHVRHPLLDKAHLTKRSPASNSCLHLLCLPGSRHDEIKMQRSTFLEACRIIAKKVPLVVQMVRHNAEHPLWKDWHPGDLPFQCILRDGLNDCQPSHLALATAGTVTLECALMQIPTVVSYRLSGLNALLGKHLIKTPFWSLPNIIMNKEIFPEFHYERNTPWHLATAILDWWQHPHIRTHIQHVCLEIPHLIGKNQLPAIEQCFNLT